MILRAREEGPVPGGNPVAAVAAAVLGETRRTRVPNSESKLLNFAFPSTNANMGCHD